MFFPKRVAGLEGNAQALSLVGAMVSIGLAVLFYLKEIVVSVFFD
jgi:hypothetical protein